MTIVCGDSHTSTHGAFGALAFGIGTSEVEHVLATQTLPQVRPKTMAVTVEGGLAPGVTAKDVALAIIGAIGTGGGVGHVIEYPGSAIRDLSIEGRMTLCNMSIEGGARAGLVAPDETTFAYLKGRTMPHKGRIGTPRSSTGARWPLTRAPRSTKRWRSTLPHCPAGHLGNQSGAGHPDHRMRPRPGIDDQSQGPRGGRTGARLHGAPARHADERDHGRHGVPGQLHQFPDRGLQGCGGVLEGRSVRCGSVRSRSPAHTG